MIQFIFNTYVAIAQLQRMVYILMNGGTYHWDIGKNINVLHRLVNLSDSFRARAGLHLYHLFVVYSLAIFLGLL